MSLSARDAIIKSRFNLILNHPFWGNLAMNLKLIEDDSISTAGTDGRAIYYSPKFIDELDGPEEVLFLTAHEVSHVVYDHLESRGVRDPVLWNIAGDFKINGDLKKFGIGEMPKGCLYDPKYENMNSYEIYDDLLEEIKKIASGSGQGAADKKKKELGDRVLDVHLDKEDMTEEEKQNIGEHILNAAQAAQDSAGNIPGNVSQYIKELDDPTIPWEDYVRAKLLSAKTSDYSMMRPSRKGWHCDAILPGHCQKSSIEVDIFIDMSGSVSNEMAKSFISEIAGMMDSFEEYKIRIATFDTKIHSVFEITSDGGEDLTDYEYKGRGGTSFNCIYDYLKENEMVPEHLIVFSDGGTFDGWGDPDYCETLWVLSETKIVPPHGNYVHM